ncbi:hypothetical protein ACVOMT_08065 [Sphingomonas panni]|uniref:hypothetical protein n=1 Tax=uncultured Sphingomonas sp. TaxID=158754 RepID=UPI00258B850F|nr:hypothetical protein [uncultured Sphingomonas sp.]
MWITPALLQAAPLPVPVDADVRCAAALQSALSAEKAEVHPALAAGMLYYIGRIEAADPALDARAAVARERARPDHPTRYQGDLVRCVEQVTRRMKAFDPKVTG